MVKTGQNVVLQIKRSELEMKDTFRGIVSSDQKLGNTSEIEK